MLSGKTPSSQTENPKMRERRGEREGQCEKKREREREGRRGREREGKREREVRM